VFRTLLIANRGEIAVRVARTCRELGIRAVAVYSTADGDSELLRLVDDAVRIGPPAARRSYRNHAAIIGAARRVGADAIHPGYGFLSEDPDFAEICDAYDIAFVGPPANVLRDLGDKVRARTLMGRVGLPTLSGSVGSVESAADAKSVAARIGYPLIIKAAAGGGGKGMTIVRAPGDLLQSYRRTRATSQAVFGDDRVYVERFVEGARHVEVQVLADGNGHVLSLGERDCSVQRHHQKLVEETPAPGLSADLVAEMESAAVHGARKIGYTGAGTFEFVVDRQGRPHFLEVNCRIQVEHPVTEMVTGLDLVREQIAVAAGVPLGFTQDDVVRRGAAVECRVNAEDPARGFAPAPGVLTDFRPPGGPFTRVDTYGCSGARIPPDYDSLLAKVITWGPDRGLALARADRALAEFAVAGPGIRTTIDFLRVVLNDDAFRKGVHSTAVVERLRSAAGAQPQS
jgi:acetyl-CoA carboxylase biotin carboxylase subunit